MKTKLLFKKSRVVIFLMFLMFGYLKAQTVAGDYQFSYVRPVPYVNFFDGNPIPATTNTYWDNLTVEVNLGFSFYFNGKTYNTCFINTNGFLTFGAGAAANNYVPISSDATYDGAVSAFGRNLYNSVTNGNAIRYKTTGSGTNRIFTVQWSNARRTGDSTGTFSFQIKLYEGSNMIEVHYGPSSTYTTTTNYPVQVGLRGASNADFNNRTTTADWAASGQGTANNATNSTTNTVKPIPNSVYRWTIPTYNVTEVLSGNGSWTVPCGPSSITVEAWGGGGAGGKATVRGQTTGGGGGGAYAKKTFAVNSGDSFSYEIGSGGSGSTTVRDGKDSWFGSVSQMLAKGGKGVSDNVLTGGLGGQALQSVGDDVRSGGNGGKGTGNGANDASGGGGGAGSAAGTGGNGGDATEGGGLNGGNGGAGGSSTAPGGSGGAGANNGADGTPGNTFGGAGGGAKRPVISISGRDGGNGAAGSIRIKYSYANNGTPPPVTQIETLTTDPVSDIGCVSNNVTLQATGGNTGAGVSTLWFKGEVNPTFAYIQEFMGSAYTVNETIVGAVTAGDRKFTSTGNDPHIDMSTVLPAGFDPTVHKYVIIRYRVSGAAGNTEIYIKRNGENYQLLGFVAQNLIADGNWHIMTIDMSVNTTYWKNDGTRYITGLRYDYRTTPGEMEIDYLAISSHPVLENTNADDTIINLEVTDENTTIRSLRIADQAALCNGLVPYTSSYSTTLQRVDKTFTASVDGNWENSANWLFAGIPNSSNCVFINDGRSVSVNSLNAEAKSIRVAPAGSVTINDGSALTITNAITNLGTGPNFVVKNNGNLIQINNNAVNQGNIEVQKLFTFSGTRNQFNYVSSPTVNTNVKSIYTGTLDNSLVAQYHIENTNMFGNSSGAYIAGRALALKEPASGTAGSTATNPAKFIGVPFNGTLNYPLAYTTNRPGVTHGYNLVGNPYSSNLDLVALYAANSTKIESTIRFWDNRGNTKTAQEGSGYNGESYAKFNAENQTSVAAASSPSSPREPSRYVSPAQGFMVRALSTANGQTLDFSNTDMRVSAAATQFFGKNNEAEMDRYWLGITTPTEIMYSAAVVYYEGGATTVGPDDTKAGGSSDNIFTMAESERIAIHGRPVFNNQDVLGLGYRAFRAGDYTISLQDSEGVFANGQAIYLKDKQTGTITNLTEGSYTFAAEAGEQTGRFEILYKPETILTTDGAVRDELQVYRDGSNFVLHSPRESLEYVQVYDAGGRLILTVKGTRSRELRFDADRMAAGMYILKAGLANGETFTRKIRK